MLRVGRSRFFVAHVSFAQKKLEVLQATWAKVNEDFGSIFSTLLPGGHATLAPQEGRPPAEAAGTAA